MEFNPLTQAILASFFAPPFRPKKRRFSSPKDPLNSSPAFLWRGGRAVYCTGLENRRAARSRGFESRPLRHLFQTNDLQHARKSKKSNSEQNSQQKLGTRSLMSSPFTDVFWLFSAGSLHLVVTLSTKVSKITGGSQLRQKQCLSFPNNSSTT